MATKVVKTLKFPGSSDTYQVKSVAQDIPRVLTNVLEVAYSQPTESQTVYFCGSDGTSLGCPENYCILTIQKGNNHRTLIDAYALNTQTHYTNGNSFASPDTTTRGTWTGWIKWAKESFKTVKVGSTNLVADAGDDTLTVTAGPGIKLTPNASNDSFEIAVATDVMRFLGSTTTAISDGSTTKTITINSTSVTVDNGDVVLYGGYEYVWTGSAWEELGHEGSFSLRSHKHTVSHTPSGTVSTPTITVTPNTTTVRSITGVGSLPSLTYTEDTASKITAWSAGTLPSLTFSGGSGSASLTGSVSTGPNRTATLTFSHTHTAATATLTKGTLPSLTYSEVDADDITAWSAGSLPTRSSSDITVVTGIKSATSTQPTFTGTEAILTTSAADS